MNNLSKLFFTISKKKKFFFKIKKKINYRFIQLEILFFFQITKYFIA